YAKREPRPDIPQTAWTRAKETLEAPLRRAGGPLPHEIKTELQALANFKVGMLRSQASLDEAQARVLQMRKDVFPNFIGRSKKRLYNKEWADAIECRSMLDVLEATIRCASERQESRGAHYRDDFPTTKEGLPPQNGIIEFRDDHMHHRFRAVRAHRLHPPHLV